MEIARGQTKRKVRKDKKKNARTRLRSNGKNSFVRQVIPAIKRERKGDRAAREGRREKSLREKRKEKKKKERKREKAEGKERDEQDRKSVV